MCNADDLVLIIVFLLGGIGRGVVDLVERVVAGLLISAPIFALLPVALDGSIWGVATRHS